MSVREAVGIWRQGKLGEKPTHPIDRTLQDQLSLVINQAKKNNPHQTALIRGDGDSALKYAARVMSLCNRAGMDYRIATLESR